MTNNQKKVLECLYEDGDWMPISDIIVNCGFERNGTVIGCLTMLKKKGIVESIEKTAIDGRIHKYYRIAPNIDIEVSYKPKSKSSWKGKYMCVFWIDKIHYETIVFKNWHECFDYLKFFIKLMGRKIIPFITSSYFKGYIDDGSGIKLKITDEIDLNRVMYNYYDTQDGILKTKVFFKMIFRRYTSSDKISEMI